MRKKKQLIWADQNKTCDRVASTQQGKPSIPVPELTPKLNTRTHGRICSVPHHLNIIWRTNSRTYTGKSIRTMGLKKMVNPIDFESYNHQFMEDFKFNLIFLQSD